MSETERLRKRIAFYERFLVWLETLAGKTDFIFTGEIKSSLHELRKDIAALWEDEE